MLPTSNKEFTAKFPISAQIFYPSVMEEKEGDEASVQYALECSLPEEKLK